MKRNATLIASFYGQVKIINQDGSVQPYPNLQAAEDRLRYSGIPVIRHVHNANHNRWERR